MTATLSPFPVFRALDVNGLPLSGGQLFSYAAGTATPQATYTDAGGATPNTNPVILDSTGSANVWLGNSPYKLVLKDSTGVQQWSVDNIRPNATIAYGVSNITSAASVSLANPLNTALVVNFTTTGKALYLPVANSVGSIGLGVPILIINTGNAFQIVCNDAATSVGYVPAGGAAILTLSGNSTANGTWNLAVIPTVGQFLKFDSSGDFTLNLGANLGADTAGKLVYKPKMENSSTTTYSITESDRGATLFSSAAGSAVDYYLPDATAIGDGFIVSFVRETYNLTISPAYTQKIFYPGYPEGTSPLILVNDSQTITIVSFGGNWFHLSGRPDIANPGAAGTILQSNGFYWQPAAPPAAFITAFACVQGGTSTIKGTPLNISSVVRFGVGSYEFIFASAYPDTNYSYAIGCTFNPSDATHGYYANLSSKGTASCNVQIILNGYGADPSDLSLTLIGT